MWALLLCIARKAYHAHVAVLTRLYTMLLCCMLYAPFLVAHQFQCLCMLHAFDVLWLPALIVRVRAVRIRCTISCGSPSSLRALYVFVAPFLVANRIQSSRPQLNPPAVRL